MTFEREREGTEKRACERACVYVCVCVGACVNIHIFAHFGYYTCTLCQEETR